jgi:hypothetical protein
LRIKNLDSGIEGYEFIIVEIKVKILVDNLNKFIDY